MAKGKRGSVVIYPEPDHEAEHERATHHEIARRLAKFQGLNFAGDYDPAEEYREPLYFVPVDVFVGVKKAHRLGIRDEYDLFGVAVPEPFMATKSIAHPLLGSESKAPPAWPEEFCRRVHDAVLT